MTNEEAIKVLKFEKEFMHIKTSHPCTIATAIELSLEALEKQISKKPVDIHKIREVIVGKCPTCCEGANNGMKACASCGQLLDWSKE